MSYDIRLTGYSKSGAEESIDLFVSTSEDLIASSLLPRTVEPIYDGAVRGYDALDPEDGFAHDQHSWHNGAGLDVQRRRGEADDRYATANGVITFAEGSFSSGYYEEDITLPDGVTLAPDSAINREELNVWGANPVVYADAVYCSFYKYLLKYENGEMTLEWNNPHDTLINSLVVYGDSLFIGIDYHDDGVDRYVYYLYDGTNFLAQKVPVRDEFAVGDPIVSKAAVVRNQANSDSLAIIGDNGYLQTRNPADINAWVDRIKVGHSPHIRFNSLTPANKTAYIGSSEGLFAYDGATNSWVNLEPSLGLFEHTDRYSRVIHRNGALYVARFDHNLWRIDDSQEITHFTELRSLVNFPAWIGMSGNIAAMAQDSNALYCMLSESPPETGRFPYAFPLRFGQVYQSTYTLIAITDNDTTSHVLSQVSMRSVDKMVRYAADSRSPTELLIYGTSFSLNNDGDFADPVVPKVRKMVIPPDEDVPYRSNHRITPNAEDADSLRVPCNPAGYLNTQWFDFFWPDAEKVLVGVTLDVHYGGTPEQAGKRSQAVIEYRTETDVDREDGGVWRPLGSTSNVGFTTIYADNATPVLFNRIRFRITLDTDIRVPVKVDSMVIHAMFGKPHRKRHQFLFNFSKEGRNYRSAQAGGNPIEKREQLGRMVHDYPILELSFNPAGDLHWLNDRPLDEPRYVRIRRFEDDLRNKARFDTRTAVEMLEVRGNL